MGFQKPFLSAGIHLFNPPHVCAARAAGSSVSYQLGDLTHNVFVCVCFDKY